MADDKFTGEYTIDNYEEVTEADKALIKLAFGSSFEHGGPGSGRYPKGSTNNEGTSNPKAYNTTRTREGYSIRGLPPAAVKVRYDGDAKRWFVEVVDSDDSLLDIRGDNDLDRTYYEWGDNKKEALEYAKDIQGWHGIPIQIESAGRVVQEIGLDGKTRNVDYKNDLKKMAKVSGEKPSKPFAKDTHAANKMVMKENTIKDNEYETGLMFNKDGEVVHTKIGTAEKGNKPASVPYTVDERIMLRDMAKNEPLSFSHNHPGSGGPHSFQDYLFMRGMGLQECRVVTKEGVRYSIRPLEGKELPAITKNQHAGVSFQVKQAFKKSGNFKLGAAAYDKNGNIKGYYTERATHIRMREETWKRMADKYGFYFSEVV